MSTILFRQCNPVHSKIVVLSFGAGDRIRLINGDAVMMERLDSAISSVWPIDRRYEVPDYGIGQFDIELKTYCSEELKLHAFKDGNFLNKALIMSLIDAMVALGYKLMVCADVNLKKHNDDLGVQSMHCTIGSLFSSFET